MKRLPICGVVVVVGVLLSGCAQDGGGTRSTRTPGEGAWYESSKADRREWCAAYRAHDPQRPISIPEYPSQETRSEFVDDFYGVLKRKC